MSTGWACKLSSTVGVSGRVSSRGVTQVAGRLRVGYAYRHTLVDIDVHEAEFHVCDQAGGRLAAIPRTSGKQVTRTKGNVVRDRFGTRGGVAPNPFDHRWYGVGAGWWVVDEAVTGVGVGLDCDVVIFGL